MHAVQRQSHTSVRCEVPLHDERWVKSSNGERELRPVIRTTLHFNRRLWLADINLTSRDLMGFRMLLEREAIRGRFAVDPGRSFVIRELVRKQ